MQLQCLTQELVGPLTRYLRDFPPQDRLHPFERAQVVLTIGENAYPRVMGRVESLRKSFLQTGNGFSARAAKAASKKEALDVHTEGFEALSQLYNKNKQVRRRAREAGGWGAKWRRRRAALRSSL